MLGEKELMAICDCGVSGESGMHVVIKMVYWAVVVRHRSQSSSLHGEHGGTHTVSTYTAVCPNSAPLASSRGVL